MACNPFGTSVAAENAVVGIHAMYNSSDFKSIYTNASDKFREANSLDQVTNYLQDIRHRFGAVASSEKQSNLVRTSALLETTVTLVYTTTYENRQARETFVFITSGGNASLLGWSIEE